METLESIMKRFVDGNLDVLFGTPSLLVEK